MKKLILAILAAGTLTTVNAQEPRSVLLYGDLGLNDGTNSQLLKTINWDANIGAGYQFNQSWTVGASVCWGQNATRDSSSFKQTENYYRVGPFCRYSHYLDNSNIFYWYAQFDLQYEGGYGTNSNGDPAFNKHTGIYTGVYPAIGMNVCRGMCLNFAIGGLNYLTDKNQNTAATYSTNTFNFTFGHMVNVGLSKNFNVGHKMHMNHQPGDEVVHRNLEAMGSGDDDDAPRSKRSRSHGGGDDE